MNSKVAAKVNKKTTIRKEPKIRKAADGGAGILTIDLSGSASSAAPGEGEVNVTESESEEIPDSDDSEYRYAGRKDTLKLPTNADIAGLSPRDFMKPGDES